MIKEVSMRYENYKDSDAKWLGAMPSIWFFNRHKDNFIFVTKKCINLSLKKVGLENIEGKTGQFISTDAEFDGDGVEFKTNDILFGKLRPYLAKVYLSEFSGNAVGDIFVYRPKKNTFPKFAQYLMLSDQYIDVINSSTAGAKMPRVSSSFIANLPVVIPSFPEQKSIANYLDIKTAQIDKKIYLLTQKSAHYSKLKQALINETVTHGLDKTVAMKDSGVEWIGDIPEHWNLMRLKGYIWFKKGRTPKNLSDDSMFPPYLSMDFLRGKDKKINYVPPQENLLMVVENELLVLWDGANAGEMMLAKNGYLSSTMAVIKIKGKLFNTVFLLYFLKSLEKRLKDFSNGTTIPHFSPDVLTNEIFGIPSINEQKKIANYLTDKTIKIDTIVESINSQIENLKELSKTLINDVVTGQIKVI